MKKIDFAFTKKDIEDPNNYINRENFVIFTTHLIIESVIVFGSVFLAFRFDFSTIIQYITLSIGISLIPSYFIYKSYETRMYTMMATFKYLVENKDELLAKFNELEEKNKSEKKDND